MAKKTPILKQVKSLKPNFWFANWMEANERLAFFGTRAILPLYMVAAVANNGLGLTYVEKGTIYGIWAWVQCLVPMLSGGFTDQYGYKKSLYVAYTINILGYLAFAIAGGFWSALGAACLIGLGTAIFKPPVQGTIAKASSEENSSIAWGFFYWMVNIGGFAAPFLAALIRGETNWQLVFFCAAGVTAFNFLPTIFFYKEPERVGEVKVKTISETVIETLRTFKDKQFIIFLAIFSGFWFMFMQLWDLLPNFIDEWVFSQDIAPFFGKISSGFILESGKVKPEMLINIDSFAIIALMLPIAWLTGKFHPMVALIGGMVVSVVAFVGAGMTNVGLIVALAIFIFAIGEMMCSPKFSEYIGLVAPPDKKAIYMGYSNIPFAVGWGVGNQVSGVLYEHLGSKINFARDYLVHQLGMNPQQAMDIPREKVMDTMASMMNNGAGVSLDDATRVLWKMHDPWMVWVILGMFGLVATVGMIVYYLMTRNHKSTMGTTPASA